MSDERTTEELRSRVEQAGVVDWAHDWTDYARLFRVFVPLTLLIIVVSLPNVELLLPFGLVVMAFIVLNVGISAVISRSSPLQQQNLECARSVVVSFLIAALVLTGGENAPAWLISTVPMTRVMIMIRDARIRLLLIVLLIGAPVLALMSIGASWSTVLLCALCLSVFACLLGITSVYLAQGRTKLRRSIETLRTTNQSLEKEVGERRRKANEVLHLNMRLQMTRDSALRATRAKDTFLAHMSHELRTPLNAIIGYSGLLKEELPEMTPEESIPDVERIETAAHHLLHLISNILDFSHLEAERIQINLSEVHLGAVILRCVDGVSPWMERQGNSVEVNLPPDLPSIVSDLSKVQQVMANLLDNAAKYTVGGHVDIAAEVDEDWIVIEVRDSGAGMSSAELDTVFDAFVQSGASNNSLKDGVGLGLAISRQYCQLLGGDIEVETTLSKGSTFRVRLPRELPEAVRKAATASLAP